MLRKHRQHLLPYGLSQKRKKNLLRYEFKFGLSFVKIISRIVIQSVNLIV